MNEMDEKLWAAQSAVGGNLQGSSAAWQPLGLRERLGQQKANAEREVIRLTELIGLLDAHPETQRILELLGMNTKF